MKLGNDDESVLVLPLGIVEDIEGTILLETFDGSIDGRSLGSTDFTMVRVKDGLTEINVLENDDVSVLGLPLDILEGGRDGLLLVADVGSLDRKSPRSTDGVNLGVKDGIIEGNDDGSVMGLSLVTVEGVDGRLLLGTDDGSFN